MARVYDSKNWFARRHKGAKMQGGVASKIPCALCESLRLCAKQQWSEFARC
jgi:hypothetical protein